MNLDPAALVLDTVLKTEEGLRPVMGQNRMTQPQLVDSHCHLDFPDFDEERDDVIARAHAAGVARMVTICTKLSALPKVQAIAEAHDGVFFAAGTHPMSVASEPMVTVDALALAAHPKMVGIGESGLDYHYTAESAGVQQKACAFISRPRARPGCR